MRERARRPGERPDHSRGAGSTRTGAGAGPPRACLLQAAPEQAQSSFDSRARRGGGVRGSMRRSKSGPGSSLELQPRSAAGKEPGAARPGAAGATLRFSGACPRPPPEHLKLSSTDAGSPSAATSGATVTARAKAIRGARACLASSAPGAQQQLGATPSCGQPHPWTPHAAAAVLVSRAVSVVPGWSARPSGPRVPAHSARHCASSGKNARARPGFTPQRLPRPPRPQRSRYGAGGGASSSAGRLSSVRLSRNATRSASSSSVRSSGCTMRSLGFSGAARSRRE